MTTEGLTPEELAEFRGDSFQKGYVAADADRELIALIFLLDAQDGFRSITRLREWSLAAVDPRPGETAVDVGCGTGTELRRLAALVGPHGRATGVEPHPGLRATARGRAATVGSSAEVVDGDAGFLPFADGSVDVVRCERVFQHLRDPGGAALEISRILRPGGRAVVTDTDWGTMVDNVGDPDVLRRYTESMWSRIPNPFAGRHLRTQLQDAGLRVDSDIGSTGLVFPDEMLLDPVMLRTNARLAVEEGAITPEEAEELETDVASAAARGEAFSAVTLFAVVGRKPPAAGG